MNAKMVKDPNEDTTKWRSNQLFLGKRYDLFSIETIKALPWMMCDVYFLEACRKCHKDDVEMLLSAGADVNARNGYGNTALNYASYYGHTKTIEMLLSKGADVNARDDSGNTALHRASDNGHIEIVRLLLETDKSNPGHVDKYGNTAIIVASGNNHLEIVRLLLETGESNPGHFDEDGDIALNVTDSKNKKNYP